MLNTNSSKDYELGLPGDNARCIRTNNKKVVFGSHKSLVWTILQTEDNVLKKGT